MLTYDYTIDRKIGEGKLRRFVPEKIPTKLGNMVLIEGPNSSGKSTLLHIIALGLYGNRNSRINPKLQSKMNSLMNTEHQKLEFSFQIVSKDNRIVLTSNKTDSQGKEVIVKETIAEKPAKIITPESFERKYNLIYDIPDNPTERLSELLKELKDEQQQFGNQIKDFYFFLDKTITQINSTRDPKHLEDIRRKLKDAREQKKKIDKELPELQTFLELLEKRAYIQYYCYYSNEGEKLEHQKQILERSIKLFTNDGKKVTNRLSKNKIRASTLQSNFKTCYDKVTQLIVNALPRNERSRFNIWNQINPYQTESDELNKVRFEATHYSDIFSAEMERMRKDPSFREASVWEKIFQALREFENSGIVIPQLEVPLGRFVKILKDENRKSLVLVLRYQTLNQIVELLEEIRNTTNELQNIHKQVEQESTESEQLSEEAIDSFSEQKRELDKLEVDERILATKCNDYYQRCLSRQIDEKKLESESFAELIKDIPYNHQLDEYLSLGENHVLNKIETLRTDIIEKRGELSGFEMFIKQYADELQELENQKPHKFEPHLEQLNRLLRKTDTLRQKFLVDYNNNLKNLMDEKVTKNE
ncbi:MAG: AAA family ATPase, partial [Candidatus Bathyarchaeia archaeon]